MPVPTALAMIMASAVIVRMTAFLGTMAGLFVCLYWGSHQESSKSKGESEQFHVVCRGLRFFELVLGDPLWIRVAHSMNSEALLFTGMAIFPKKVSHLPHHLIAAARTPINRITPLLFSVP